MEHSELFLLLPRYEEAEGQPDYIRLKSVMTVAEILEVIESIDGICRFIANENYEGYYDADNVSAFLYPVEVMEECYPNIKTRMRMVMSKWGENWRTQKVQKDTVKYMYYCIPIKDDTLCEMTERKFVSKDESTFLLINYDAFSCTSETIITKRNQDEVELNVRNADIKNISKMSNLLEDLGYNVTKTGNTNSASKTVIINRSNTSFQIFLMVFVRDQDRDQWSSCKRQFCPISSPIFSHTDFSLDTQPIIMCLYRCSPGFISIHLTLRISRC